MLNGMLLCMAQSEPLPRALPISEKSGVLAVMGFLMESGMEVSFYIKL